MIAETPIKNKVEFVLKNNTLTSDEIGRLITLFQVTDDWLAQIDSPIYQKHHAVTLRLQLHQLGNYYFDQGERNKSKLAVSLYDATFFAESEGLTQTQIEALQFLFTYFLRIMLTHDDLDECEGKLFESGIHVMPTAHNISEFLALSST
ncbi:MAG: hypothetical protein AAF639_39190 [Chloroflexota bacterium]